MEKQPQLIFCTCPDRECAETLANTLVDEHLAACVNLLPNILSIYHWKGQRETTEEVLLLIKTHSGVYPILERRLRQLHPYELPEIIAVPVENGLPAYLDWISEL